MEAERCRAEEQAKKCISHFWLVIMELTVVDRGGHCATVQQGQCEGIGATSV